MGDKKEPGYYYKKNKTSNARWNARFAEIKLRVLPDRKDAWRDAAEKAGESMNTFITNAVEARIKDMEG